MLGSEDVLSASAFNKYVLAVDALPIAAWLSDARGRVIHLSPGLERATGVTGREVAARGYAAFVHPGDLQTVARKWDKARTTGEPYRDELRFRFGDGSFRWISSEANPLRDERGDVIGWLGTIVDIDDRVRADSERDKFVLLAERSAHVIGITDADGHIVYANPAAVEILEISLDELMGKHFFECFPKEDEPFMRSVIFPALQNEGRWIGEFRLRNFRTGQSLPILYNAFALSDASGTLTGFATISRDMRARQRFDIGIKALADAGKAMHDSLDFVTTMQNIADAVVSSFANVCSVEVADAAGAIRTTTLAARDPAHVKLARELSEVRNARLPADHPIHQAISLGRSTLKFVEPAFLQSTGLQDLVGRGSNQLDLRSIIYVPVRSPHDGRIYAVLSCGLDGHDPRGAYAEEDVRFAEEIGVRAGLAFDNAHAYERTFRIAAELQGASLPALLPAAANIQLSAEYRPATDEAAIGGDWYDAFLLQDGRLVMTIGDVTGHGLEAAIWMTKMRQAMQAAAMLAPDPRVMLEVANRTLLRERDVFATALAAIYDGPSRTMAIASAGHPGPTIARQTGAIEEVDCPGVLLGVSDNNVYGLQTIVLNPGDLVVFYTDGLVEAERDIRRGLERLREALRREDVKNAEDPALGIFEAVLAGLPIRDDVAILTALVT
jgi:PAS domain S-box-containing protein